MIFITGDVLNSAGSDSISFCEKFEIVGLVWASNAHTFSLPKMASEVQKLLAKMNFY